MTKLWVKFKTNNATQVSTEKCLNVDDFLRACKKKLSPLLDSYAPAQLSLSTTADGPPFGPGLLLTDIPSQPGYSEKDAEHPLFISVANGSISTQGQQAFIEQQNLHLQQASKNQALVDNLLETETVESLSTGGPAAKKLKGNVLGDAAKCDKILTAIDNLGTENLITLKQIKDVPFASIIEETDRFSLNKDECFTYQGRTRLQPLWEKILERWSELESSVVNVIGTVGYGKSHMLAVLAAQLMKEEYPIIYIPDCGKLVTNYKNTICSAFKLLFPRVSDYGQVNDILRGNPVRYDWIVIADQWNSIDEEKYDSIRRDFVELFGMSNCIVKGMSMNSTVWKFIMRKQHSETNILYYGGFDEDEFSIWMKNQTETLNRKLFKENKDDLVRLTGRVPLYLSIFASLYQENIKWNSLVEAVMADNRIEKLKACIGQFYKSIDAENVWKVYYAILSNSTVKDKDLIDRRFFYESRGQFLATGEISTILLYSVWKEKAADDQILKNWPHLLRTCNLNASRLGFLVEEVIKAVVCRDGISKYIKANHLLIERRHFKPGNENGLFVLASQNRWILFDPDIYNYAGVDMILVTDTTIVGINVTIASTHNPMTSFFKTWKPIADKHHLLIQGLFVAGEDFTHDEENVEVVHLKNIYHTLWEALRLHRMPLV